MYMEQFEDKPTLEKIKEEYSEMITGIFPALHKYKTEHSTANLQKLCVEIAEFDSKIASLPIDQNDTMP